MKIKDSIRGFIIKDQLGNALEFLNKLRIEEYDDEIIHHFATFNEIKSAERKGILKHEDVSAKMAILRNGILQLTAEIEKFRIQHNKKNHNSYEILNGYEINSESLFGTKSNPLLGYNDNFYLQRDYLDKELRTSILFNQNILLKGNAGSGKSRALLELIKRYLTKYNIVLPIIDSNDISGFSNLKSKEKTVVIYDDINLFFKQNHKTHLEAIKEIVASNKLSIIATCRYSEVNEIKEYLGEVYSFFKNVEIKPLNTDDVKSVSKALNKSNDNSMDDNIGNFFE